VIEGLRQRFLARFVEGGRERVQRALEACEREPRSFETVARELHALAGEAALLELSAVADLAQAGEAAARSAERPADACARLLREIDRAVAALGASSTQSAPP
jgi:HPt (histidine-containing phosphotransfer) domain-containing protein